MKKILLSLFIISAAVILQGCGEKNINAGGEPGTEAEMAAAGASGGYSGPNGAPEETVTKDENGNEVITTKFPDGAKQVRTVSGKKRITTHTSPGGDVNKTIEEELEDGSRMIVDEGPDGVIHHKMIEKTLEDGVIQRLHTFPDGRTEKEITKDLGNGRMLIKREVKNPDGSVEKTKETHENFENGHKTVIEFEDGRIFTTINTHSEGRDKNETITKYPDGRTEKTSEERIFGKDGKMKVIRINPDGTKEERIEG